MPGLYGIINFADHLDKTLTNIGIPMKHEPWYIHDQWKNNHVLLGRVHQGILSSEKQPASNEDKTLQLMLYGYILDIDHHISWLEQNGKYGHQWSPSLVTLYLYRKLGDKFVERLNGSFSIAVWDGIKHQLKLFTDRLATRQLYYTYYNNNFLFSSEIKCLLQDPNLKREVDLGSIASLLTFGSVIDDKTLLKSIKAVPSGSILHFNGKNIIINKHWDLTYYEGSDQGSIDDYADELNYLLKQAIKRSVNSLQPNQKIGLALSGGLDSRIIAGCLKEEIGSAFNTYTYGRKKCPDFLYASKVADILGVPLHFFPTQGEYITDYADETLLLTEGLLSHFDSQATVLANNINRQDVSVIWTGFGGETLWGGDFLTWGIFGWEKIYENFTQAIHNRIGFFMSQNLQKELFKPEIWSEIEGYTMDQVNQIISACQATLDGNRADYFTINARTKHFTTRANLLLLTRRFDYQIPSIDNDLMDFSMRLPLDMRLNYRVYNQAVINKFPNLAKVPKTKTHLPLMVSPARKKVMNVSDRIRKGIRYRLHRYSGGRIDKKPSYIKDWDDRDLWTKTNLRPYIEQILLSDRCLSRGYFEPDKMKTILSQYMNDKHSSIFNWVSPLMTLELWHKMYLDD